MARNKNLFSNLRSLTYKARKVNRAANFITSSRKRSMTSNVSNWLNIAELVLSVFSFFTGRKKEEPRTSTSSRSSSSYSRTSSSSRDEDYYEEIEPNENLGEDFDPQEMIGNSIQQILDKNDFFFRTHGTQDPNNPLDVYSEVLRTQANGDVDPRKVRQLPQYFVSNVYDGDTLFIKGGIEPGSNDYESKIRLYGVDTPETNQFFGKEAGDALRDIIYGKMVNLLILGKDQYDRYLAVVFYKGRNMNYDMVAQGLAFPYHKIDSNGYEEFVFNQAYLEALENRLGMWNPAKWKRNFYPEDPFTFKRDR